MIPRHKRPDRLKTPRQLGRLAALQGKAREAVDADYPVCACQRPNKNRVVCDHFFAGPREMSIGTCRAAWLEGWDKEVRDRDAIAYEQHCADQAGL